MSQPAAITIDHSDTVLGVECSVLGQRWRWRTTDERAAMAMAQRFGMSDILARILIGRGVTIDTVEDFLSPSLRTSMPDPMQLKDMDKAIARLVQAVEAGETIGVFGDYDVDGATSSALLHGYFSELNIPVEVYIPDRQKEGYGPNIEAFRSLQAKGCQLIVTVDCGAVAFDTLSAAKADGMDVIVLDHHIGAAELPEAVAVVNPNRLDESSPCTYLAAVGVTFMTLVALNTALREQQPERRLPDLLSYLDLVALGTVCDVVPLKGMNRALVAQGLKVMQQRKRLGMRVLADVARMEEAPGTYHLGFLMGPRINAGGRVGEADLGIRLLSATDESAARQYALRLDEHNAERKAIELMVQDKAMEQAERQDNRAFIMVAGEGWHQGVIGIVAGRLKERFNRPAAVLSIDGGEAKASARSVPGVDLGATIAAARAEGLLLAGGGHAMAAGFSVAAERIDELHAYMESRMDGDIAEYLRTRAYTVDACVAASGLTAALAHEMAKAAPYGMGNASPRLVIPDARVVKCDILKDVHIRLILEGGVKAMAFKAIGTPLGERLLNHRGRPVHLAGTLKTDVWQGREQVSFHIDDADALPQP